MPTDRENPSWCAKHTDPTSVDAFRRKAASRSLDCFRIDRASLPRARGAFGLIANASNPLKSREAGIANACDLLRKRRIRTNEISGLRHTAGLPAPFHRVRYIALRTQANATERKRTPNRGFHRGGNLSAAMTFNLFPVNIAAIDLRGLTMADIEDSTRPLWRWPRPRLARAAFLAGEGRSPGEIASDPEIRSTAFCVRRILNQNSVMFRDVRQGINVPLSPTVKASLQRAASARALPVERLVTRLATILASDLALLDNVLDDGTSTPLTAEAAE